MNGSDLMKLLGRNLRAYRQASGKTQEKFSEQLGINESTYKNIERGARGASFDMIASIAERLGVSPSDLFLDSQIEVSRHNIDKLLRNRSESFIMAVEKIIQALDQYNSTEE